jgi:UDP-glucose 4-epimerase
VDHSTIGLAPANWQREFAGKTVAVSGASGFIGARVVDRLGALDCRVVDVARDWASAADADVVFHFAAQTSVAFAERHPDQDFEANVVPMRRLIAACDKARRGAIIVFAGTVTQAGITSKLPVGEDTPDSPVTVYDRHKLMAEDDLKAAAKRGDVRGVSLRLSNVYGPGGHGRTRDRDVLNRMIAAAWRGDALTVYGSGEYLRDYVFVDDVAEAFLLAAAHPDQVNGRHFVIGSGRGVTIREAFEVIAARVERRHGRRVPVIMTEPPAPLSAIEQRHFVADPSRFFEITGWRPLCSFSDGIDRTIEALACA